ncbi:glycoside hydrolase, partial [Streptomyces sp. F63]|nr:glycoside hydrolase [Streptomyces sp. F63]
DPDPTPTDPEPTPTDPVPTPTDPSPSPVTGDTFHLRPGGVLATTAATAPATDTLASAEGANYDGIPHKPLVYEVRNVNGTLKGGGASTDFRLKVDAGVYVGLGQQVRISYDLTGDGSFDRVETYRYFATDPLPGYEDYTPARTGPLSSSGTLGDLRGGTVRAEVWSAIGNAPSTLQVGTGSVLTIPFR